MNPDIEIRTLRADEAEKILPQLNEEFIIQRGRRLALERRFPNLFSAANADNCFAAFSPNGEILSFVATEARTLKLPALKIFFVGCVFTVPEARGRSLAGKVLELAVATYRERGFAAGYLWTRLNDFYARLGWKCSDRSVLMTLKDFVPQGGYDVLPFGEKDAEMLAADHLGNLVRRACDYFKVPPPADVPVRLRMGRGGYLCGGIGQSAGYVYELCSDCADESYGLLSAFSARYCGWGKEIWINLQPEQRREIDLLRGWFPAAEIGNPALQMNLIFAEEHKTLLDGLNIPYLDRI